MRLGKTVVRNIRSRQRTREPLKENCSHHPSPTQRMHGEILYHNKSSRNREWGHPFVGLLQAADRRHVGATHG